METHDISAQSFLTRLGDLCTTIAVHRDYLQRHVEQLESVEAHCRRDVSDVECLEVQLSKAIDSAERVAAMSSVLETARKSSSSALRGVPSRRPGTDATEGHFVNSSTPLKDILRFSKAAEAFDGEAGATQSILTHVESSHAQVARSDYNLRERKQNSIRYKLAQLESLKASCREVDVSAVLEETFGSFQYSPTAETLFFSTGRSEECRKKKPTRKSSSSSPLRDRRDAPRSGRGCRDERLVTPSNVADVICGAVERLTLRYGDALNVLSRSIESSQSSDDRLLYAVGFSQQLSNQRADAVRFATYLRDAVANPTKALQEEYDDLCASWVAAVPSAAPSRAHAINTQAHIMLPPTSEWVDRLCTVSSPTKGPGASDTNLHPPAPLLPPAKHIMTRRFSAADTAELQSLESLRVQLQTFIAESMLELPPALSQALPRLQRDWHRSTAAAGLEREGGTTRATGAWTVLASTS